MTIMHMTEAAFAAYRKRYLEQYVSQTLQIDVLLGNTIHYLNKIPDLVTLYSCQGHTRSKTSKDRSPYIAMGVGSEIGMGYVQKLNAALVHTDMELVCYNGIVLENTVLQVDPHLGYTGKFIPAVILRQMAKTEPAIHSFSRMVENAAFDVFMASRK